MKKEENPVLTEDQKKEQARKISVKEGSFTSLMDGFGLRYITPYALALGATNAQIGFLSSFPNLIGNLAQLFTLKLLKKHSRKSIVLWAVIIQTILWLPLILAGYLYFYKGISVAWASTLVIAIYAMLVLAGAIGGPAWSSWMKDILSSEKGKYFSNRNKIITGIVLASMLIAGSILQYFEKSNIFFGFAIIFSIAFLGRLIASFYFTKEYEPQYVYKKESAFTLVDFVEHMTYNNFGRFVIFISFVSFATAIAGPFFAVYMLKNLGMNYISYTAITLSSVIATLLFLPIWGIFSDIHGNVKILRITSFLIPLVPFLWMLSPLFLQINYLAVIIYLFVIEMFSGFAWAGFNHASATFIYDAVSKEKMPYCITYFNIITGAGIFIGAMVGGYVASVQNYPFGMSAIFAAFLISGVLRLLAAIFISPIVKEVRPVEPFSLKDNIKKQIKEREAILTTQFWKFIGYKPVSQHQPLPHH